MDHSKSDSEHKADNRYVSTAQVALALGVSVTTVKRWVDESVLPAHRTAGGHRKLLVADVLRIVQAGNLPQADLSHLLGSKKRDASDPDPTKLREELKEAISRGDTDWIRTIIHSSYDVGIPVEVIADRILAPALTKLGEDWQHHNTDVMAEHMVMQACMTALYEIRASLRHTPDADRPVAIGGAPEHDHYILPTLLAKMTLFDNGWRAINMGPHTPLSAFRSAILDKAPKLVWMSVTYVVDPDKFLNDFNELHQLCQERKIPIAVGGQGLRDELRSRMQYTSFGDGMCHLAAFARTLNPLTERPKRGRPVGSKHSKGSKTKRSE